MNANDKQAEAEIYRRRFLQLLFTTASASSLPACGGGGGGSEPAPAPVAVSPSPAPTPTPPAPTPPAPTPPAPPASPTPPAPAPTTPAPPPPPAPTGAMAFSVVAPTAGTWPFTLGFGFRQGDIPSGTGVSSSLSGLQVVVKNRWPDGSAKFAVVAGRANLAAASATVVTLAAGSSSATGPALTTTDLVATGATATLACGSFGLCSWAGTDWQAPFMNWVSGPVMSSWIYRKPVGTDSHLVAWLELRLFAGGAVEVLPWVENGFLNVAAPGERVANYSFSLGGTTRFNQSISLLNHQRTPLVNGEQLSHWLGSDPGVIAIHDTAYLQATRLVPTYRITVAPNASMVTALPATFTPLQQSRFPAAMGSGGYHSSIGLLPEWDVIYLTSNATQVKASVERCAYSAGRYGIHFRDETTHRPLRFSAYPNLVVGGGSGVQAGGASTTGRSTPNATGASPPTYASSHHSSMGYLAGLITGRWYHLETAQFLATLNFLKNGDSPRLGSAGVFQSATGSNTTRGVAWAVRSLAQAACLTADDDPLAAEFRSSLASNISWYHARYVAQPNNPQGFIQPYSDYTAPVFATAGAGSTSSQIVLPAGYVFLTDGYYNGQELVIGGQVRTVSAYAGASRTATVSTPFTVPTASQPFELRSDNTYFEACWMQDFVTAAFGYTIAMGVPLSASDNQKLLAFFAWKALSIVGRFGGAASTEFLYRDAAQYTIAIAPSNQANWVNGTGPWFANWGALYDAMSAVQGSPGPRTEGALRGGNYPDPSSYWGNLMPALTYAVEHGVAGAADAYNKLQGASNWSNINSNFAAAPVWAVRPR